MRSSVYRFHLDSPGVDEIYLGKKRKFVTVVSNLESREPL